MIFFIFQPTMNHPHVVPKVFLALFLPRETPNCKTDHGYHFEDLLERENYQAS